MVPREMVFKGELVDFISKTAALGSSFTEHFNSRNPLSAFMHTLKLAMQLVLVAKGSLWSSVLLNSIHTYTKSTGS